MKTGIEEFCGNCFEETFVSSKNLPQLKNFSKGTTIFSSETLGPVKEEMDNYSKVTHPSFALKKRELMEVQSKSYLVDYFLPNIGIKLSDFYLKNKLSLATIKQIMLSLTLFNKHLSSLELTFSENIENFTYVLSNQKQFRVYFAIVDFSTPIDHCLQDQQQKNAISYFKSITSKTDSIKEKQSQVKGQRTLIQRLGSFYVKMLVKSQLTKVVTAETGLLLSKMLNSLIGLNQVIDSLSFCKLDLSLHSLQVKLTHEQSQSTVGKKKVQFKTTNKYTHETNIREVSEAEMPRLYLKLRSLEQLQCELTTTDQQVFLNRDIELCFYCNNQLNIIKLKSSNNQELEERQSQQLVFQNQSLIGQLGQNVEPIINTYPYDCIGLVQAQFPKNKYIIGTGSLVASNLVITNAHVIVSILSKDTKKLKKTDATSIYFILGGKAYKIAKPKCQVSDKYFSDNILVSLRNDYAILLLEEDIKRDKYFKIAKNYKTQNNIFISGQSSMKMKTANIKGREILRTTDSLIFHNVQTEKGDSGSPIFVQLSNNSGLYYLIGIHSALQKSQTQRRGIKITQQFSQKILEMERKYSKTNQQIEVLFVYRTLIVFQDIEKAISIVSKQSKDFLDWVAKLYFEKQQAKQGEISSYLKYQSIFKFIVETAKRMISKDINEQQIQPLDDSQIQNFDNQFREIYDSLLMEDGTNMLTIYGLFHILQKNAHIYPYLLHALTRFLVLCLQCPKIITYFFKQQKVVLRKVIWQKRQTIQLAFDPFNIYEQILKLWYQQFKAIAPSVFADFQRSGIKSGLLDSQGKYRLGKSRPQCFKSIRWFVLLMHLLEKSQLTKNCLLLINIWQSHFDKNAVYPNILKSYPQNAEQFHLPLEIPSPYLVWMFEPSKQKTSPVKMNFEFYTPIESQNISKQKCEKFGRNPPDLSYIRDIGVRHRNAQLYVICYSQTEASFHTIQSYLELYTQIQEPLFINILYSTISLLHRIHKEGLYLLCPLEFCLVIQTVGKVPKIIFKDHYQLLRNRLTKIQCPKKIKRYNRYYPTQTIIDEDQSPKVCEEVDRLILQKSLKRLLMRSKINNVKRYLDVIDKITISTNNRCQNISLQQLTSQIDQSFKVTYDSKKQKDKERKAIQSQFSWLSDEDIEQFKLKMCSQKMFIQPK